MGLSFITAAGPRQRGHSRARVPWDSWPYFIVSDSSLPQHGGPGPRIYMPQEQGDPVIPPGTEFPFHRLLRLDSLFFFIAHTFPCYVHIYMHLYSVFHRSTRIIIFPIFNICTHSSVCLGISLWAGRPGLDSGQGQGICFYSTASKMALGRAGKCSPPE
jgi:hypothetical protein